MVCDRYVLVCWDDEGGDAGTGEAGSADRIGGRVQVHAEPARALQNPAPDLGRMFADTRRENQRIEPAERGGERAQFAADAIDKKIDRPCRARIIARVLRRPNDLW